MTANDDNVVKLPSDFIGKTDESKLESFGAHLIAHGAATRWHWRRSGGVDTAFLIYRGGRNEKLLVSIARDSSRDVYYANDPNGRKLTKGSLEAVMTIVDAMARSGRSESPG
jgi:hypothetical protein